MRSILLVLTSILAFLTSGTAHGKPPNVIVILADDIGAREFRLYDPQATAKTPTMDSLARSGVWITTAWSTPMCLPTRAMVMTGRYAYGHKWYDNRLLYKPDGEHPLPLYESSPLLIGHIARESGYATFWAGKAQTRGGSLDRYGFDEGVFTPGSDNRAASNNPYTEFRAEEPYPQVSWYWWPSVERMHPPSRTERFSWLKTTKKDFGPDIEFEHVADFMKRQTKAHRPFFVYHTPHLGHKAVDFLNDRAHTWVGVPEVVDGKKTGNITPPGIEHHIEYLDYLLSLYVAQLERLGIRDDTVIIFTSDNGTSDYGKGTLDRQRGTHVPFVIHAPGRLEVRGRQELITDLSDIWPTLADLCGFVAPEDYRVDGRSLWPYLTGKSETHRDWIYSYLRDRRWIRGRSVMQDGRGNWWDVRGAEDGDSFAPLTVDSDADLVAEKRRLEAKLAEIPSLEQDLEVLAQWQEQLRRKSRRSRSGP